MNNQPWFCKNFVDQQCHKLLEWTSSASSPFANPDWLVDSSDNWPAAISNALTSPLASTRASSSEVSCKEVARASSGVELDAREPEPEVTRPAGSIHLFQSLRLLIFSPCERRVRDASLLPFNHLIYKTYTWVCIAAIWKVAGLRDQTVDGK